MLDEKESVVTVENEEVLVVSSTCVECGANLEAGDSFCPNCGREQPTVVEGAVSDAIAQFNQGIIEQAEKKKKKKKILKRLLIIGGSIAAIIIAVCLAFNSRVEKVINGIQSTYPSITTIKEDYEALTPVGRFLFKGRIVSAFVDHVSENQYVSSSDSLVNEEALDDYKVFKQIAIMLDLSDTEGKGVVQHINTVLQLTYYEEKYNAVSKCINSSADYYIDCLDYIGDAADYSSYYVVKLYVGSARSSAQSALSSARAQSSGDALCQRYVNALSTIAEELDDLYYGYGYYSSYSFSSAMETISEIIGEVSDAEDNVISIIESIPEI